MEVRTFTIFLKLEITSLVQIHISIFIAFSQTECPNQMSEVMGKSQHSTQADKANMTLEPNVPGTPTHRMFHSSCQQVMKEEL